MGGLPANDTDAAEVDKAMQELADGFLGASGELSGDEWTSTPPSNAAGGTADTGGTSGERSGNCAPPRMCAVGVYTGSPRRMTD